jgi:hypothetical protein
MVELGEAREGSADGASGNERSRTTESIGTSVSLMVLMVSFAVPDPSSGSDDEGGSAGSVGRFHVVAAV